MAYYTQCKKTKEALKQDIESSSDMHIQSFSKIKMIFTCWFFKIIKKKIRGGSIGDEEYQRER